MEIAKEEAIKIANKEVINLGYDIKSDEVGSIKLKNIKKYDTNWEEVIRQDIQGFSWISWWAKNPDVRNKLKNKKFWAIYYAPKHHILGGDVCVFIDFGTGEVITCLRGK